MMKKVVSAFDFVTHLPSCTYKYTCGPASIYLDGVESEQAIEIPRLVSFACLHLQEGKNAAVGRTITRRFVDQVLHTDGMSEVPLMTVPC